MSYSMKTLDVKVMSPNKPLVALVKYLVEKQGKSQIQHYTYVGMLFFCVAKYFNKQFRR